MQKKKVLRALTMSCRSMEQIFCFFILSYVFLINSFFALSLPQNPDTKVLLSFKHSCTSDSIKSLSSWNESSDPCNAAWQGVSCHHGRVNRLILEDLSLACHVDLLAHLPFLYVLSLKNNSFNGSLDSLNLSAWRPHLKLLYLSHNEFSGPFPHEFLSLKHLHRLDLAGNKFSDVIPPQIGVFLANLSTLRLENNVFSGVIPDSLSKFSRLSDFNLSFNKIEGRIPRRLASFPLSSFVGNLKLCGNPLPRRCFDNKTITSDPVQISVQKPHKWIRIAIILSSSIGLIVILITATVVLLYLLKERKMRKSHIDQRIVRNIKENEVRDNMVFFEGEREEFSMEELMGGSAEMLGRGQAGTTYRVVMQGKGDENGVVVKRVRRERKEEEERRERRALMEIGGFKHSNVVSLRGFYSSPEELLLVFDFVTNGSLYHLLHANRGPGRIPIDWQTRLKITQDAARGLTYLHNVSKSNLSHQHLTSSNILIDSQGNALISDFSLLRLISNSVSTKEALESQKADVYSFGVIVLEILTGRTTQDCQADFIDWVRMMVKEEWTSEHFDMELWGLTEIEDEMMALLQVALLCVANEVKNRPKMETVYKMIEEIRDRGSRSRSRSSISRSPSLLFESSSPLSEDTPTLSHTSS